MSLVRRAARVVAFVLLAGQIAAVAASTAAVYASAAVAEAEADCACGHGGGIMCPMHHASRNSNECAFRSGPDSNATVPLLSLFSVPGVLQTASSAPRPSSTLVASIVEQSPLLDPHHIASSPPPRA